MNYCKRITPRLASLAVLWVGLFSTGAFSADAANYDTSWTFVYDAGLTKSGEAIQDNFRDVKVLPGGSFLVAGETRDSTFLQNVLVMKLSPDGKLSRNKLVGFTQGSGGASVLLSRNGDYVVGGWRFSSPLLMRLDTNLNVKSTSWFYDSVAHRNRLSGSGTINSMLESGDGHIRAVAGDIFPENNGQNLHNYAAYLEFDSNGTATHFNEWKDVNGYDIEGWSLAPGETGGLILGGKQALFFIDTNGTPIAKNQFNFTVPGTGSQVNNVTRVRQMRDGSVKVVGQSYEEDCWTRYGRLYYDAWWSKLNSAGGAGLRNVGGVSGAHDYLYDLVTLTNGNIAFVGAKGTPTDSGLWVFVTDSSTKNILWEKQYDLPGLTSTGFRRKSLLPISMAATADSGFIVVGQEPAPNFDYNAFAFKFSPRPIPTSLIASSPLRPSWVQGLRVFAFEAKPGLAELVFYDVQGKPVARYRTEVKQAGPVEFQVEPSRLARGLGLWRFQAAGQVQQGKVLF